MQPSGLAYDAYLNVTALAHVAESTLAGTMSSAAATARQVRPDSALVW
jgi:hypothetical protein